METRIGNKAITYIYGKTMLYYSNFIKGWSVHQYESWEPIKISEVLLMLRLWREE